MPRKPKKRGRGRPPLPEGRSRASRLSLRLTPAEGRALRARARREGLTVTDLVVARAIGPAAG